MIPSERFLKLYPQQNLLGTMGPGRTSSSSSSLSSPDPSPPHWPLRDTLSLAKAPGACLMQHIQCCFCYITLLLNLTASYLPSSIFQGDHPDRNGSSSTPDTFSTAPSTFTAGLIKYTGKNEPFSHVFSGVLGWMQGRPSSISSKPSPPHLGSPKKDQAEPSEPLDLSPTLPTNSLGDLNKLFLFLGLSFLTSTTGGGKEVRGALKARKPYPCPAPRPFLHATPADESGFLLPACPGR